MELLQQSCSPNGSCSTVVQPQWIVQPLVPLVASL